MKNKFYIYNRTLIILITLIALISLISEYGIEINEGYKITDSDWRVLISTYLAAILVFMVMSLIFMLNYRMKFTFKNVISNLILFPVLLPLDSFGIICLPHKQFGYLTIVIIICFIIIGILTIVNYRTKSKIKVNGNKSIENEVDKNE